MIKENINHEGGKYHFVVVFERRTGCRIRILNSVFWILDSGWILDSELATFVQIFRHEIYIYYLLGFYNHDFFCTGTRIGR
jgi:hypothetical protein